MTKIDSKIKPKRRHLSTWGGQGKEAGRAVQAAMEVAAHDNDLRRLWLCCAQLAGEVFGYQVVPKDDMDARYVRQLRAEFEWDPLGPFRELARRFTERKAPLAHMAGPLLLDWLRWIIVRDMAPELEITPPDRIYRLLPDNPITFKNAETWDNLERATSSHLLQAHALVIQASKSAGPVGRPPGGPKPAASGRSRLDPELAKAAYQLRQDGRSEGQIAKRLFRDQTLSPGAAKQRVRRLLDLARRLSHQKKTSKAKKRYV